tara:strand:- start:9058 stop:9231 length:174 start_codon:yes stop_codon:yes gene_type:complete
MKIEMSEKQFEKLNYAVSVALILAEPHRDTNPKWVKGAEAAREVLIDEVRRTNNLFN